MCLATPVKVIKKNSNNSNSVMVEESGIEHEIDISLVGEVSVGQWLLCHENLAINKLEESQAKEILNLAKSCPHQHGDHSHHH
jgi:hydrogenase expression/formation protein HypC